MLKQITPLILTLDEAPNIDRVLARISWARDIIVVDSGSKDETKAILARHKNVRVFERRFTTHAEQWNFGLEQTGIRTDWVLALDADFTLSDEFVTELASLGPGEGVGGYRASFIYCIDGRPLGGTVYPPVVVLYRRTGARYAQDGHTQRIQTAGRVETLEGRIFHDDRKPLARWLASQARYMRLEAEKLLSLSFKDLGYADQLRRAIVIAPLAMFLYCFILRGGFLDGRLGLFYALQRATAEAILSLYLVKALLDKTVAR